MYNSKSLYREFVEKHFPFSGIIKNENIDLLYLRVCENNLVTDIFEKYICDKSMSDITCQIIFLQRYKIQFNKFLLFLPVNDLFGINSCMRVIIENLLKFFYSIYVYDEFENINKIKFRNIKEKLNKIETDLFMDKESLNVLFNYYGHFSNYIHDKTNEYESQLKYIESIIELNEINLNELDQKLVKILNIYEKLICKIFKINEETLSVGELIRLKNNLPKKRYEKIKEYLK